MREINRLSIHQWLRSAIPDSQQPISPIGFLFLKLPQPPCAVLLVITTPMLGRWNHGFLFPYHFCLQATVTVTGGYLISLILLRAGLYEELLSWRSSLGRWKKSGCQSQQPAVSWHDLRPGVPIVGVLLLETYHINETPMWCLVLSQVKVLDRSHNLGVGCTHIHSLIGLPRTWKLRTLRDQHFSSWCSKDAAATK